ncbi:MAG: efflux RND transporter permease subunit, partial [Acidobacteriaceae bacterium]|nr:efflux RND transporter permease subunit [Acidobacteriaceae bacterium]
MLSKIIDVSVRHRWVVLALALLACFGGWQAMRNLPLDATPDLSEKQVIILSRWDRSPDIVEDQVTYPIVTAMLGAPHVKNVRGISDFGYSYVYVTFDDTTDLYWARSRTSEYLSGVVPRLPEGVKPQLGPDATALGWVYQYALVDTSGRRSLAELRSLQDWYLRYYLQSVPGVAEIALIGGYERQYQITVDPNLLRARAISLSHVVEAVRRANQESSGRVLEFADTEYVVRSRGYAHSLEDFANIPLGVSESGSQLRLKDIGRVGLGPDLRRGVADLDGRGETVSGIVIMRNGMNALDVVRRVKRRLDEIAPDLPSGVKVVPVYDRSELIQNTIGTVKDTILQIAVTVALTVAIFLWHFPSAVIPILTTPVAVLLTFLGCRVLGIEANVMSLAGVALAFSELSDASIVVVEQTHKRLEVWDKQERPGRCSDVVLDAVKEVSIPAFFALLVIAVSFLPVILLPGEEGRMFQPLAYTKTLTLIVAAVLAVTLDPALRLLVTRAEPFRFRPGWLCACLNRLLVSRIHSEEQHPATRLLMRAYEPVVRRILKWKWEVVAIAMTLVLVSVPVFLRLGTESIPPLDEGSLLYMPSTLPGVSVTEAEHLLRITDRIIRSFPQVDHVLGKAGRAETATDPAPLSMLETVIVLKPRETWPRIGTWYSSWAPDWLKPLLRRVTSDTISTQELIAQMNAA